MSTRNGKPQHEKVRELHDQLAEGVAALASDEDWRRWLDVAARFHDYSPTNTLLIMLQRPDATQVAGYRKWQELGRQVRKGERGIQIMVPSVRSCRPCDGDGELDGGKCAHCGGSGRLLRFRVGHVFDVSQTEGDELPAPPRLSMSRGSDPAGVYGALAELVRGEGYTVERGDPTEGAPGALGVTDHVARSVVVGAWLDDAQAARVLAHELAHVLLHNPETGRRDAREVIEVEAESTAYVVSRALGVEGSGDSFSLSYVTGWSGGDVAVVRGVAERVQDAARRVLEAVDVPDVELAAA